MELKIKVMEHAENDLDPGNEKELIVQAGKEQKWRVKDIANTDQVESTNIGIIEWNEPRETIIESGREAGNESIEDLLKKNTMMIGSDISETNVIGSGSRKYIDRNGIESASAWNLVEVEKDFLMEVGVGLNYVRNCLQGR